MARMPLKEALVVGRRGYRRCVFKSAGLRERKEWGACVDAAFGFKQALDLDVIAMRGSLPVVHFAPAFVGCSR